MTVILIIVGIIWSGLLVFDIIKRSKLIKEQQLTREAIKEFSTSEGTE